MPMEVLRYLTFLGIALTLLGPIVLPTRDGGSVTRLLLLPIPRTALYVAQVAGRARRSVDRADDGGADRASRSAWPWA